MAKRFRAALTGQGGYLNALRSCWATRFYAIKATVESTGTDYKIEMTVHHDAKSGEDIVKLKRVHDQTGETWMLYTGHIRGIDGYLKRKRFKKD